jgi:hypothetical protein
MPKATVTTKEGTKIVIEGTEKEVVRLVKQMGATTPAAKAMKASPRDRRPGKRLPSATDAILELNQEGFFDKPKGLADIKEKLASQGMIYPVTTLSGVVLSLTRKRALGRVREDARWCYVTR